MGKRGKGARMTLFARPPTQSGKRMSSFDLPLGGGEGGKEKKKRRERRREGSEHG